MKATGIVRRIDDLGRVVIPKEIRRTMRIREGDPLEIFTDREGTLILKKYSPIGELSDFAAQMCESLRDATELIPAVCDRESVISAAGAVRRELIDKPLSSQLCGIMDSRSPYCLKSGGELLPVLSGTDKYSLCTAVPIVSQGDILGSVLFASACGPKPGTETDRKLAGTAAAFLGKQIEG